MEVANHTSAEGYRTLEFRKNAIVTTANGGNRSSNDGDNNDAYETPSIAVPPFAKLFLNATLYTCPSNCEM